MYQISTWAAHNKALSMSILTVLSFLLCLIGFEIGLYLFAHELIVPIIVAIAIFAITAWFRYRLLLLETKKKSYEKQAYYYRYKRLQLGVYIGLFFVSITCGNAILTDFTFRTTETTSTYLTEASVSYLNPPKSRKKGWFKQHLSKRAKQFKQLKPTDSGIAIVGTIFIILLLLILVAAIAYVALVLACTAFCSDLVAVGVLALLGGLLLIGLAVFGAVKWLQWIWNKNKEVVVE